jgi:hypothetical protein
MATELVLHLEKEYFEQIARGKLTEAYRLRTPYWERRLIGQKYENVRLLCGYPKRGEKPRELVRKFKGWRPVIVNHPDFGSEPVRVFAIDLSAR